jgi:SAM-dependent methyltransferase
MISYLKEFILREQFRPGIVGLFINPFYFARRGLFKNISSISSYIKGKTLDVGCGRKPYEKVYHSSEYIGLELDTEESRRNKKADKFYDGKTFPFEKSEFDSVIANQVFEHVFNPDEFLSEINRVLKIDGNLLITVPFVWDEHEQPYDYARYSSFGLKSILAKHGFKIKQHIKSVNDVRVIFQLINGYIYKKTVTRFKIINYLFAVILMSPFTIIGIIFGFLLPQNNDLYLDNIVLATKINDSQSA